MKRPMMKRLLAALALAASTAMLSGCYIQPDYGYVRGNGYAGDAYYGSAPVYSSGYYAPYYGYYGYGYGYGCCWAPGLFWGGGWYGGRYYRGGYRGGWHGHGAPAGGGHAWHGSSFGHSQGH